MPTTLSSTKKKLCDRNLENIKMKLAACVHDMQSGWRIYVPEAVTKTKPIRFDPPKQTG